MRRRLRGAPGELSLRLARAEQLVDDMWGSARAPLQVLVAVLRHQATRADTSLPNLRGFGPGSGEESTQFRMEPVAPLVVDDVGLAVDALRGKVPVPLAEAGAKLRALPRSDAATLVETWLEDPALVDPLAGFWLQVAAAPLLESAAVGVTPPDDWQGAACPVCGGQAQASVIVEESGEFMAGSPRRLVCGRCASWWSFPRVTCVGCGEDDTRAMESFLLEDRRWARVDTCSACRGYVKTFDLRQPGAAEVVPLVDDVATLALDVWVQQRGFSRAATSLAGV